MPRPDDSGMIPMSGEFKKDHSASFAKLQMEEKKVQRPDSYIGTKIVTAVPMTKEQFSGGEIDGLNPQGYKITYDDGYESWSPKEVFERCYRKVSNQEVGLING